MDSPSDSYLILLGCNKWLQLIKTLYKRIQLTSKYTMYFYCLNILAFAEFLCTARVRGVCSPVFLWFHLSFTPFTAISWYRDAPSMITVFNLGTNYI